MSWEHGAQNVGLALMFMFALFVLVKYVPLPEDEARRPSMVRFRRASVPRLLILPVLGVALLVLSQV